jgi:hypothetical protein
VALCQYAPRSGLRANAAQYRMLKLRAGLPTPAAGSSLLLRLARPEPRDFFAKVEHIYDWEHNRRLGLGFPLELPEAAIEPSEDSAAIGRAFLLRASQASDGRAVTELLEAIAALLTASGARALRQVREVCKAGDDHRRDADQQQRPDLHANDDVAPAAAGENGREHDQHAGESCEPADPKQQLFHQTLPLGGATRYGPPAAAPFTGSHCIVAQGPAPSTPQFTLAPSASSRATFGVAPSRW